MSRTSSWSPARWAASCPDGAVRADVVFTLVQELADLGADAEGRSRRAVPRPPYDLGLPDQVAVMAADLRAAADAGALAAAAAAVQRAARRI